MGFNPEKGALSHYPDISASLNTLVYMMPGGGHRVKMKEAGALIYP